MMRNPYRIEGPALVSFSGGRTSGYMLRHILDAHGGSLPADVHVAFFNTGKERPETLEFVAECAERWAVKIRWLEFDPEAPGKTREVNFSTASRNGEPFEALIEDRQFLPNTVYRTCTEHLKIKRGIVFMRDYNGIRNWVNCIGLRADEMRRVAKQRARNGEKKERFETIMPMAEAGHTKEDVLAWWALQEFDLRLPSADGDTPMGNCDLCFMKNPRKLLEIIRDHPESAEWWIRMEGKKLSAKPSGAYFRYAGPTYKRMAQLAPMLMEFDFPEDESLPCNCTD